jgi:beta-glucosidase
VESTLNGGLDLEMPGNEFLTKDNVLASLEAGRVTAQTVDDKVRRMLRVMLEAGLFDSTKQDKGELDTPAHRALALETARAGAVLLKNDAGFLPLDRSKIKTLAVIGPHGIKAVTGGGGSSIVSPFYAASPAEALKEKLGDKVEILAVRGVPEDIDLEPVPSARLVPPGGSGNGLLGEYWANEKFEGEPVLRRVDAQVASDWGNGSPDSLVPPDRFSARWTGSLVPSESGVYLLGVGTDDGSNLWLDGKRIVENGGLHGILYKTARVRLEAGRAYKVKIEMYEAAGGAGAFFSWRNETLKRSDPMAEAVDAAKRADAVLLFVGNSDRQETEGMDRSTLAIPAAQEALLKAVAAVNPNAAVVLHSGASVVMDGWLDKVRAVVEMWFPGEEGGRAAADILFGDVNPSGKLPATFIRKWEDSPAFGDFPGARGNVDYAEGIFVGYRYFDTKNVEPLFPFGYGLSYTTFEYSDLRVSPSKIRADGRVEVRLTVKNTGKVAGAETVQLYVSDPEAGVERPSKELKGFKKVVLNPGQSKPVSFTLDRSALSYFDPSKKEWVAESGAFKVLAGASSRDIRLEGSFELE